MDSLYASSINSAPSEEILFELEFFWQVTEHPNVTNYIVEILTQKYITRYIKVQFKGPKDMLLPGESKMSH